MSNKIILFIITEDWYFISHRRDLAKFASLSGFNVNVLTNINNSKTNEIDKGINIIDWNIKRSSKNILKEFQTIKKIKHTIDKVKPDIIHAVGMKPILYSGILSKFYINVAFLYAFAGLGSIFTNTNLIKYIIQRLILLLIKIFFNKKKSIIIFQNLYDLNFFNKILNININKSIIKGSGIDYNKFKYSKLKNKKNIQILLPARILYHKGIEDFIFCSKEIKKKYKENVTFVIAGKVDSENPSVFPVKKLNYYVNKKIIVWLNNVSNIKEVYDNTHIICFPSFREGNPKALLESACCQLPIVAYDVAGCNDIIINNKSGYLIPFRDKILMKSALEKLIKNNKLREEFGLRARDHVIKNFSNKIIHKLYEKEWNDII